MVRRFRTREKWKPRGSEEGRAGGVGRLALHDGRQTTLCEALETLIDGFPQPDEALCAALGERLAPHLRRYHRVEETFFFPALERRLPASAALRASLRRLEGEHREDHDAASELSSELLSLSERRTREDFESIAYHARALFRNVRRHVAGEADFILPLAGQVLNRDEMAFIERAYERLEREAASPIHPLIR